MHMQNPCTQDSSKLREKNRTKEIKKNKFKPYASGPMLQWITGIRFDVTSYSLQVYETNDKRGRCHGSSGH